MSHLQVISLSAIQKNDEAGIEAVAAKIGQAARETGFFYITDHGVDPALIARAYAMAEAFFAQSDTEKMACYIGDSRNHRGYVPFTERGDYADETNRNYEAFDLGHGAPRDDPDYQRGVLLTGPNRWPELPGFRQAIGAYYDRISALAMNVCRFFEIHFGVAPGVLTGHMTKPISQLRLLHYVRPPATSAGDSVNMGAHTDYECLTLLHQRQPGLQVMTRNDEWIDVPVRKGDFVVNIGDMLEAWTNGVFRATPHRVLNLSPERYSMPFFLAPNHDTVIAPLPGVAKTAAMRRYTPFLAGEHLQAMLARDFPYLRRRLDRLAPAENPFEDRLREGQVT